MKKGHTKVFVYCIIVLFHVSVNGMELGRYLYLQRDGAGSVNIERPGDSEDVKQVKSLLSAMVTKDATARPSIQEVVDNLNYLLATLRPQQLQMPDFLKSKDKSFYGFIYVMVIIIAIWFPCCSNNCNFQFSINNKTGWLLLTTWPITKATVYHWNPNILLWGE